MTRTFIFSGTEDATAMLLEHKDENVRLEKGKAFHTDDESLARALAEHPNVKEVKESPREEKPDAGKKPSREGGGQS